MPVAPPVTYHIIPAEALEEVEERCEDQQQNELEDLSFVNNKPVLEDLLEGEEENDDDEEQALVDEQEIEDAEQHIIKSRC